MEVSRAYAEIPGLLQKVINDNDTGAWAKITGKIDYIYANLDYALQIVGPETGLGKAVQAQIRSGKKLLFKTNLVCPQVIRWLMGRANTSLPKPKDFPELRLMSSEPLCPGNDFWPRLVVKLADSRL